MRDCLDNLGFYSSLISINSCYKDVRDNIFEFGFLRLDCGTPLAVPGCVQFHADESLIYLSMYNRAYMAQLITWTTILFYGISGWATSFV